MKRYWSVHCLNPETPRKVIACFGPIEAAKKYTTQNLPGFECLPCNRQESPGLWRNEAVNHGDNIGVVLWIREVY